MQVSLEFISNHKEHTFGQVLEIKMIGELATCVVEKLHGTAVIVGFVTNTKYFSAITRKLKDFVTNNDMTTMT